MVDLELSARRTSVAPDVLITQYNNGQRTMSNLTIRRHFIRFVNAKKSAQVGPARRHGIEVRQTKSSASAPKGRFNRETPASPHRGAGIATCSYASSASEAGEPLGYIGEDPAPFAFLRKGLSPPLRTMVNWQSPATIAIQYRESCIFLSVPDSDRVAQESFVLLQHSLLGIYL